MASMVIVIEIVIATGILASVVGATMLVSGGVPRTARQDICEQHVFQCR